MNCYFYRWENRENKKAFIEEYIKAKKVKQTKIQKTNNILKVMFYKSWLYGIFGDYDKYNFYNQAYKTAVGAEKIREQIENNREL